jgi:hypothetical protein
MESSDDFFGKLDERHAMQAAAADALTDARAELRARFLELLHGDFEPLFRRYHEELTKRGIQCDIGCDEETLALRLHYKDGGINELHIVWDGARDGAYKRGRHTDDDGARFSTEAGIPGLVVAGTAAANGLGFPNVWDAGFVEKALQEFVESHHFYANRHGGVA